MGDAVNDMISGPYIANSTLAIGVAKRHTSKQPHKEGDHMSSSHHKPMATQSVDELTKRMGEAAADFLASLSTDQRAKTVVPFANHDDRTEWHYTPRPRLGLPFLEMDRKQQRLAYQLIARSLSRSAFVTTTTIMGLEPNLDAKEGWETEEWFRDGRNYYIAFFDEPHGTKPWSWRFEGHHVSLNYTIVDGRIISPTPTFFGANPADSPLGVNSWLRPLGAVEDLARELVFALDNEQQNRAIVADVAPPDIVSLNRPYVVDKMVPARDKLVNDPPPVIEQYATMDNFMAQTGVKAAHLEAVRFATQPKGLAASAMTGAQKEILVNLIGEYIHRMPDELAEIEMAQMVERGIENIHFVWAGPKERHKGHYYRLQGPRFLVEYDNIQNDANHIHSVWRDPENDFGRDLLANHYLHSH